jgi:hypothetical protein
MIHLSGNARLPGTDGPYFRGTVACQPSRSRQFQYRDFRASAEADWGSGDADPAVHVELRTVFFVQAPDVEGALVRTLIGNDLTRVYQLSGKQLILKSSRSDEHWTIAWEHF